MTQDSTRFSRTFSDVLRGVGWYVLLACSWAPGLLSSNARFSAMNFVIVALLTIPAMTMIGRSRRGRLEAFAAVQLRKPRASALTIVAASLLTAVFAITTQAAVLSVWPDPPGGGSPLTALEKQPFGAVTVGILALLVAPLTEELTIRGRIQHAIARRYGSTAAVAISATIFALIHGSAYRGPQYLLHGVVLGAAAILTRSVWTSIAMHVAINAASSTLNYADVGGEDLLRVIGAPGAALLALASLVALVAMGRRAAAQGGMNSRRAC